MHKSLILVSQSPRRRELMELLRTPYKTASPKKKETLNLDLNIVDQIQELAKEKVLSVIHEHPESVLIGADTVIVLDDQILGKPQDETDAFNMLKKLSNRTHEVITGVYMASKNHNVMFYSSSKVTFYEMSDEDIQSYVDTREPMGKSGSYSIQGGASLFLKHIDGDHNAIMGLPIGTIYQHLMNETW